MELQTENPPRKLWWLKFTVTVLGYVFAFINLVVPPKSLAPLPDDISSGEIANIRIGVFSFITAISLLAGFISTGREFRDKAVHSAAVTLGILAVVGAGFHALHEATDGKAISYMSAMGLLAFLLIVAALMGVGIGSALNWVSNLFGNGLDAVVTFCLRTFVKGRNQNRQSKESKTMEWLNDRQKEALRQITEYAFDVGKGREGVKFEDTLIGNEYLEIFYRLCDGESLIEMFEFETADEIETTDKEGG